MIHLLGAALLLGGGVGWGVEKVWRLRRQLRMTEALLQSLHHFCAELVENLTPLPELLEDLAQTAPAPVTGLFAALSGAMCRLGETDLEQLWTQCIRQYPDSGLDLTLRRELSALGQSLGRYAAPVQAQALTRCLRRLETLAESRRRSLAGNSRLYLGLSLCTAIGAVVIFL